MSRRGGAISPAAVRLTLRCPRALPVGRVLFHLAAENTVQRIEAGKRFVTDIELRTLASFFGVSADSLLEG